MLKVYKIINIMNIISQRFEVIHEKVAFCTFFYGGRWWQSTDIINNFFWGGADNFGNVANGVIIVSFIYFFSTLKEACSEYILLFPSPSCSSAPAGL